MALTRPGTFLCANMIYSPVKFCGYPQRRTPTLLGFFRDFHNIEAEMYNTYMYNALRSQRPFTILAKGRKEEEIQKSPQPTDVWFARPSLLMAQAFFSGFSNSGIPFLQTVCGGLRRLAIAGSCKSQRRLANRARESRKSILKSQKRTSQSNNQ